MERILPPNAQLIPEQAECVYKGDIYDTYQWRQELFDGSKKTFEMLRRPDSVGVIGVVNDLVAYVEDVQPHDRKRVVFPGGRVDPGETWDDAAKRETLEETGFTFRYWKLIEVVQPVAKIEWFAALFVAWEMTDTQPPHTDAGEKISVLLAPPSVAVRKIIEASKTTPGVYSLPDSVLTARSVQDLINIPEYTGKAA